jgi:hypothetical protein
MVVGCIDEGGWVLWRCSVVEPRFDGKGIARGEGGAGVIARDFKLDVNINLRAPLVIIFEDAIPNAPSLRSLIGFQWERSSISSRTGVYW